MVPRQSAIWEPLRTQVKVMMKASTVEKKYEKYLQGTNEKYKSSSKPDLMIKFRYVCMNLCLND